MSKHSRHNKRATIAERVLREIKQQDGMRFRDIQRFAFSLGKRGQAGEVFDSKKHRGWWCNQLIETGCNKHNSLLNQFCQKRGKKWYVTEKIKPPFFSEKKVLTYSYYANRARIATAELKRRNSLPKCKTCDNRLEKSQQRRFKKNAKTCIVKCSRFDDLIIALDCDGQHWFRKYVDPHFMWEIVRDLTDDCVKYVDPPPLPSMWRILDDKLCFTKG